MFKASIGRTLCCLFALLSWQVSGTFHPLASMTSDTSTTVSGRIGTRREHNSGAISLCDAELVPSVLAIRGGGAGSMVSDFNNYIGSSKFRSWTVLVFSILTDTVSVTLMKAAQAESSVPKLVISFLGFFLSLVGFALALKSIDVSIAYAIWASVGTAIVSVAGIVFFGECLNMAKIICLAMILLGVVGLELTDEH